MLRYHEWRLCFTNIFARLFHNLKWLQTQSKSLFRGHILTALLNGGLLNHGAVDRFRHGLLHNRRSNADPGKQAKPVTAQAITSPAARRDNSLRPTADLRPIMAINIHSRLPSRCFVPRSATFFSPRTLIKVSRPSWT